MVCLVCKYINRKYQPRPEDTHYPSETKELDRPIPSPESGHSAGCSWAPVQVQEQPVPAQALRERVPVPGQGYWVLPQRVQRARQCRWKYYPKCRWW